MVNKVFLQGRLTADPEVSMTRNGKKVANFSVAVERPFKGQDGNRKTDFLKCETWGRNAETVERFFKKGNMILVVGSMYQDSYTDNNGNRREKIWCNADEVHFCESKKSDGDNSGGDGVSSHRPGRNGASGADYPPSAGYGAGGAAYPPPAGYGGDGAPYPGPAGRFEDLSDSEEELPF